MTKPFFLLLVLGATMLLSSCAAPGDSTSSGNLPPQAVVTQNRPMKMIGGKPYVYVNGELGSNVPGRWVPADSPAAQAARSTEAVDRGTVQKWQSGYR